MSSQALPAELHGVRENALRAIAPIRPADAKTKFASTQIAKGLYESGRTDAGRSLPSYYLVYFLLVSLLGFEDQGKSEKIAWSIPIDLDGVGFLIDHRKFGVGVFTGQPAAHEEQAARIVNLIQRGVSAAKPFFRWVADEGVRGSRFNVLNKSEALFQRYEYLHGLYDAAMAEAEARKKEKVVKEGKNEFGSWTTFEMPYYELKQKAAWLATATIEAFFGWTEHIFIHLGILQGRITTGTEFKNMVSADWSEKFKRALEVDDPKIKKHYDDLILIRRQARNFMAHSAFGKGGEALHFHSATGAVPVALDSDANNAEFLLGVGQVLTDTAAIETIDQFIKVLWQGPRAPAHHYIQESNLPLILPMASDGRYARGMASDENMEELVRYLQMEFDNAANMDW